MDLTLCCSSAYLLCHFPYFNSCISKTLCSSCAQRAFDQVMLAYQKVMMFLCRLVKRTLFSTAVAIRLEFDGPRFAIEWSIGKIWKRQVVGKVQNIRSVDIMVEEVQVLSIS